MHTHPQSSDIERVNKKKKKKMKKARKQIHAHTYTRESIKNQSL